MSQLPTILAYVSYSTVHEEELIALKTAIDQYNGSENQRYQMEIKYSENTVELGENFVEFMDEIALARFVVLLFSKEYFESPYCLYELLKANEKQKNNMERFIILPVKLGVHGTAINTYTVDNVINAWQGKGEISQSAQDKGADFCQSKLRELLGCEDVEIESLISSAYDEVIKPWLHKNIPEQTCEETVRAIEAQATNAFETETKEFDKFILAKINYELGLIKKLEQSWENYSGDTIKSSEIAKRLMEGDYSESLTKIQAWAKAEKCVNLPNEWKIFFNRIQKIAGWFVLKSINHDWWINNLLSFTEGTKNHGFVKLCLEEKHFSYSEVVVSKALRKSAQFILNDQNRLTPQTKEYAIGEGNDFVFDCNSDATLHTLLIPIVTDLRKTKPQIEDANELLEDLLEIASTNTDNFFYLVTESYLKQLKAQLAPDGTGKTVLEVINEKLEDKLFFISIDTENVDGELQVTNSFMQAITLMENILLIDK